MLWDQFVAWNIYEASISCIHFMRNTLCPIAFPFQETQTEINSLFQDGRHWMKQNKKKINLPHGKIGCILLKKFKSEWLLLYSSDPKDSWDLGCIFFFSGDVLPSMFYNQIFFLIIQILQFLQLNFSAALKVWSWNPGSSSSRKSNIVYSLKFLF